MIHEEDVSVRKLKEKIKVSHQTADSMLSKICEELNLKQNPKRRSKWRSMMYFSLSPLVVSDQPEDPPTKEDSILPQKKDKIIKDKIVKKLIDYIDALTS
jgi:hypothetical protein